MGASASSTMRIRLVVTVEGEAARWHREVERPYPGVPRAGDWVYLGEGEDGEGLMATPIAVVSWENDGVIARPVAKGPEAIVELVHAELGDREERPLEV